jgi:ATPase subunit of ABC transporter with duplicated ATPase domains
VKDYRFWEEGFGPRGVKALIIREILPTLNHKLAGYSREIFGDGTTIQLSATQETKTGEERELLNLQYNSPSGASSYIGESSGGRRRADLCVLLVFSWLARASNILFVDEMLDHLDAGGRERALSILQEQRGSVFIVTHERGLKSQLAKTWTVIKEHKASRVEFSP